MYKSCKLCKSNVHLLVEKYNLGECETCKLIFSLDEFTQDDFIKTYNELYNKNANSHYNVHTDFEYQSLLKGEIPRIGYNRKKIIDRFVKGTSSKVLEIGSGVGLIAAYLKSIGITEYLGLEIDTETNLKAQKLGFNTLNKDFRYMRDVEGNFNFIMLWEVLEHLQDLDSFLSLSAQKLKKNDVLMFSVPNFDKRKNYKNNADNIYQDAPPIHLNFFTKKNLNKILENYGFEIEFLYIKKRPYLNFKSLHFYKMLLKSILGTYNGSTIYLAARKI
jgi:2-polyprenyl-3-methyl-5-hydroxy-6-metoxy-1,4-benzoquinol methylase